MMAVAVRFKRAKDATWENGVGISQQDEPAQLDTIVDAKGLHVPHAEMWDFEHILHSGCVVFTHMATGR